MAPLSGQILLDGFLKDDQVLLLDHCEEAGEEGETDVAKPACFLVRSQDSMMLLTIDLWEDLLMKKTGYSDTFSLPSIWRIPNKDPEETGRSPPFCVLIEALCNSCKKALTRRI